MGFTEKQVRNGTNEGVTVQNSAQPGPDFTANIGAALNKSVSVGDKRVSEALDTMFVTPFGAGVSPVEFGGDGSMWDWDSGLAVPEQPGEA